MSRIIGAKANLGQFDARYGEEDGESWIKEKGFSFLATVQMLNLTGCDGSLSPQTEELFRLTNKVRHVLEEPWNTGLPQCPRLTDNLKKIARVDDGDDDNNNEPKPKKKRTSRQQEHKKRSKSYREVTPPPERMTDEDKIRCQHQNCFILFSSQGAMKSHFQRAHQGDIYIPPPKTINPSTGREWTAQKRVDKVGEGKDFLIMCVVCQVTCRACLPHISQDRSRIKTHLAEKHHIEEAKDRSKQVGSVDKCVTVRNIANCILAAWMVQGRRQICTSIASQRRKDAERNPETGSEGSTGSQQ